MKQSNAQSAWKQTLLTLSPYIVALILFIAFCVFYCYPMLESRVLQAGDVNNWKGISHQTREYTEQTGENCYWSPAVFSGMPTYQISCRIPSQYIFQQKLTEILHLGMPDAMALIFGYLLCFFIMLRCFRVNPWISIIGAFAIAMSSYFFLIIPAGHMTKAAALGLLPAIIGGLYRIFRKDYCVGVPIVLLFGMTGAVLHPQMTYYICMLIGVLMFAELCIHIREKRWLDLLKNIGIVLVCVALIAGTKLSWWKLNQSYLHETMRGMHSELTVDTEQTDQQTKDTKSEGLDIKYATDWSYGIDETMTLLIPNFMGGATNYELNEKSVLYKELIEMNVPKKSAAYFCSGAPTYRGEKPFTSGPVYVGAIICFLFVLALIIVPGPYKWALLIATLFSIVLAWGRNLMPITEFFFSYFPMYNRFRAVESILVVAEITIPLLALLGLHQLTSEQHTRKTRTALYISAAITAGLCLFFALFGGLVCDFTSSFDQGWIQKVGNDIYVAILDQRAAMLKADAWRSFVLISVATLLIWLFTIDKLKKNWLYVCLLALVLIDLVPVNKRFFSNNNFITNKQSDNYFVIQPWEEQILQDKSLGYRVINLTTNTFNDARTSYRLNSVGGYHAAKLRRYQDLIEAHISKNNFAVLNMLNTKYFITQQGVFPNPDAFGAAWAVDSVCFVATPNEESQKLWELDLRTTAVADEIFTDALQLSSNSDVSLAPSYSSILPTEYTPNRVVYNADMEREQVVVFSEIYYPHDWHLYLDDKEIPLARVNYVLRAAVIPAGRHTLRMQFEPQALKLDILSTMSGVIIMLLCLGCVFYLIYIFAKNTKNKEINLDK